MEVLTFRSVLIRWFFLEVLGNLVVIGVMLVDAQSRRIELTICEITIFSISMLCYVLADLDSPFNGFFRVDLSVIPLVIHRVEELYQASSKEARHELLARAQSCKETRHKLVQVRECNKEARHELLARAKSCKETRHN